MPLLCLGLSHKTAPVEIRERLAFPGRELGDAALHIAALPGISEAVVVSTCNRMEIYAGLATQGSAPLVRQEIEQWLRERFQLDRDLSSEVFFHHSSVDAVRHLFAVAGGLDSMVLGETEIFGQVKEAYHAALAAGATRRNLNKLFQEAFRVGKAVRNTTDIQRGATSIGAVAVELAEKLFGDLTGCRVMLLGAGEISRRTAQSLQSRGARGIIVSNRNYDRAVEMAQDMGGQALHFDGWQNQVPDVDILIGSTAAPHPIVRTEDIEPAMRLRRGGRPLFIIDIAVPRDVEAAVNDLENVYLFDIDALEQIADQGRQRRERELEKCRRIIDQHVENSAVFRAPPAP
ncbi:MAG: glutamyl-tRNA reductase [Verrucomicrobiales bacterium]|nr:glutamyl-tRNA reductase [Verrucomicrobiales bacterium]